MFKYKEVIEINMETLTLEKKIDLILDKLEKIEELLFIEEAEPYEDELEAIKEYLEEKKKGKLELVPLKEALDEI